MNNDFYRLELEDGNYAECIVEDMFVAGNGVTYAVMVTDDGIRKMYYCRIDKDDMNGEKAVLLGDDDYERDYVEQRYMKALEMESSGDEVYEEYEPTEEPIEDAGNYLTLTVNGIETECDITRLFVGPKRKSYAAVEPVNREQVYWTIEFFRYKPGFFGIFGEPKLIAIKDDEEYQAVKRCYDELDK